MVPSSRLCLAGVALLAMMLPACSQERDFCLFGYSTRPNYNTEYRTVRVPIFKNRTFVQRLEVDLTKEVVRQIEDHTPYKVVPCGQDADTELVGVISFAGKNVINRNQLNEVREAETLIGVELVWTDLKTGEVISKPRRDGEPPIILQTPAAPNTVTPDGTTVLPPILGVPEGVLPPKPVVVVQSLGHFIPELGGSITTSQQQNIKRLATQIVSMMEIPW